ncbi:MAG: hypothetical protein KJ941_11145 [Bacteroidetes bacterium]|nr:hypothetical protein [Bacteroidota bacterium]
MVKRITTAVFVLGIISNILALSEIEKAQVVENVYKKMCAAKASNTLMPKLVFNSQRAMQIAYMTKDKDGAPTIGFESKAFDVCAEMGDRRDDAIAFLLGHELSHHFLNHLWGDDFKTAYSLGALEKDIRDIDRAGVKKLETQADVEGGILCYLAGYGTSGIGEKLLSKLYAAYEINVESSVKYPSLAERIEIARSQDSIVQTYIRIYETGNYSMLIGEYDFAISCFNSILYKGFNSASIYNNLGVAYFLSAVKLDELNPLKYYYPIELDVLMAAKNGASKGMARGPMDLYEQALDNFKKATNFDAKNFSAHLNIVCTYSAMGNLEDADYFLKKLEKKDGIQANMNTYNNVQLLKAILMDQSGDKTGALALLKKLEGLKLPLASVNKAMIENNDELADVPDAVSISGWASSKNSTTSSEKIHGISNYSIQELNRIFPTVQTIVIAKNMELLVGEGTDHRVCVYATPSNQIIAFHTILKNYKEKSSRGLALGSDLKDLEKEYGAPDNMLSSNAGTYYMYSKQNIIFQINAEGKISNWVLVKEVG